MQCNCYIASNDYSCVRIEMDTRNTIRSTKQKRKAVIAEKERDDITAKKRRKETENGLKKVSQKSKLIRKKINHIKKYIKSKCLYVCVCINIVNLIRN